MAGLVRWLPQIVRATADDIARFGPQAARVRSVLDFLPTMSDDAARVISYPRSSDAWKAAMDDAWKAATIRSARDDAYHAAMYAALDASRGDVRNPAGFAAMGEVVSDLIDPTSYRTLTSPLAMGRAFDIVQRRGAPEGFSEIARALAERRALTQPADIVASSRFARLPQKERDAVMEALEALLPEGGLADSGFDSLQDIIDAARLLG